MSKTIAVVGLERTAVESRINFMFSKEPRFTKNYHFQDVSYSFITGA